MDLPIPNAGGLKSRRPWWTASCTSARGTRVHAADATTGMELWNYSQPRTEGIQERRRPRRESWCHGAGDSAFYETDHAHLLAFNRSPVNCAGTSRWPTTRTDTRRRHRRCRGRPPDRWNRRRRRRRSRVCRCLSSVHRRTRLALLDHSARGEPAAETWKGRRSSMDAVPPGCPAPTIPR